MLLEKHWASQLGGLGGDSCSATNTRQLSFLICKMKDLEKMISKVP